VEENTSGKPKEKIVDENKPINNQSTNQEKNVTPFVTSRPAGSARGHPADVTIESPSLCP
jgi:hypothetical protein